MTRSTARITLRQLSQLGLPAPLVLPSLLPVLREVVRADHAAFFFCDAGGNITNLYAERLLPPDVQARYHDKHNDAQFRRHYLARVAAASAVSRRSVSDAERQLDYYREVLKPLEVEHFLYAIVRAGSRVIGSSACTVAPAPGRSRTAMQSTAGGPALPRSGAGDASPSVEAATLAQSAEEGLAVFDSFGQVLFADAAWGRLVRMAEGNAITPATALHETHSLPRFVAAMLEAVEASPNAVHRTETAWGSFAFRRHQLEGAQGQLARGLIVSRLSAEPLRLTASAGDLGLSPKQRQVALLLAQGLSNVAIARELHVTPNTASYHVKQVSRG
jgi:DNA-binding CsgD family transcriptional regulator